MFLHIVALGAGLMSELLPVRARGMQGEISVMVPCVTPLGYSYVSTNQWWRFNLTNPLRQIIFVRWENNGCRCGVHHLIHISYDLMGVRVLPRGIISTLCYFHAAPLLPPLSPTGLLPGQDPATQQLSTSAPRQRHTTELRGESTYPPPPTRGASSALECPSSPWPVTANSYCAWFRGARRTPTPLPGRCVLVSCSLVGLRYPPTV